MDRTPVIFSFDFYNEPTTIMKVTGTCQAFDGAGRVLISTALDIIDVLQEFGGELFQAEDEENGDDQNLSSNVASIYFYVEFEIEEDLIEAFQTLQDGFGF